MNFGPEHFNNIIKLNLPAISEILDAYKLFKHNFPNTIKIKDNTGLTQPIFYNLNFTRNYPGKCKTKSYLTPTFYGLDDKHHTLMVKDFYEVLAFKTQE